MLKRKVIVSLSPETQEALDHFSDEFRAVRELVDELAHDFEAIRSLLTEEILAGVPVDTELVGVEVFKDRQMELNVPKPRRTEEAQKIAESNPYKPSEFESAVPEDERIRTSPFSRTPRGVQVEWIKLVLADGAWHNPTTVARDYADDERALRYMKHAIGGRMREMWEEGHLERRESHVRGAMYEYRLRPKKEVK
jgi:hypothetical protein